MSLVIIQAVLTFVVMFSTLWLLAKAAPKLGFIDIPSARKLHKSPVPSVGGLSIYITIVFCILMWPSDLLGNAWVNDESHAIFVLCMSVLVGFGALDDRFDVGLTSRIVAEVLVAAALATLLDLRVINLGDIFSIGAVELGPSAGYVFTIIAIFGVINAINMLDGLDGLAATTILASLLFFQLTVIQELNLAVVLICVCIAVFLLSNLQLIRGLPKTFLGDAGSKLLGLISACLLLAAASSRVGGEKLIAPATALYMIAIPLFDMVFTVTRRALKGHSPFSPDRTHIHHLLLSLGYRDKRALTYIVSAT